MNHNIINFRHYTQSLSRQCILPLLKGFILYLLIPLQIQANPASLLNKPQTKIQAPFVELASKQIPIPNRTWIIASTKQDPPQSGPVRIAHQVLFRVENGAVRAFVIIHTNITPSLNGWGISQDCQNHDHPFTAVFERKNQHYKCAYVHSLQSIPDDATWSNALVYAKHNKLHLPENWIVTGIRVADRLDIVDVRYGFDPQALIGTVQALQLSPKVNKVLQETATEALIKWHEIALYLVGRGFRRQLGKDDLILPMPRLHTNVAASIVIASRLQKLEALYTAGWLSEADFIAQQNLIKQSFTPQANVTVDIWRLGALKTAGHTVQSGFWMWGMNYLFLGNAHLAGTLALTKSFISPIRYYLEEMAWNTWGPRRNPTLPIIDFPSEIERVKK